MRSVERQRLGYVPKMDLPNRIQRRREVECMSHNGSREPFV